MSGFRRGSEGRARVAGHFGELIQGRLGPSGPVALVTLPCPRLGAEAAWRPGGAFRLHAGPSSALPSARAAALMRAILGRPPHGRLILRCAATPGGGAGASTASLLAAALAATAALGVSWTAEALAALCLRLEGATDPLTHPSPARVLWLPREAAAAAALPPPPPFEVVGAFFGPGRRTDPRDLRFPDVTDLLRGWPEALARGDAAGAARLATCSARRCVALRGGAPLAPVEAVGAAFGALGLAAAHTGSARALLFAPGAAPSGVERALVAAGGRLPLRFSLAGA